MSLTAQFFISGVEQSHFAEHYQFLVMINPFIAEKAILEKHKIVWKAFTTYCYNLGIGWRRRVSGQMLRDGLCNFGLLDLA